MIYNLCFLLILIHSTTSSVELSILNSNNTSESAGSSDFHILERVQGNILCRSCGNDVTSSKDLISKLSPNSINSFRDSIFDKDDVLIQVFLGDFILNYPVIITSASNCVAIQEWEEGESWFPGYRWKPCVCPDCGEYLGWVFELIDSDSDFVETPSTFFGLILTSLIGESCKYIQVILFVGLVLCLSCLSIAMLWFLVLNWKQVHAGFVLTCFWYMKCYLINCWLIIDRICILRLINLC